MSSAYLSNNGINLILDRAFKTATTYTVPSTGEIGTDSTTATASDTALGNRVPHTRTSADDCDAIAGWVHSADAGQVVLNTTAGEYKEGTGCLNTPSTYATGTATWTKTLGAGVNMSSAKYCGIFFYVVSKTNLGTGSNTIVITLGTGGVANSNYFNFADTAIVAGWNFLIFTADDPTGTNGGGATLTNVDTLKISVKITDSWTGTQMRMDDWWYATEANHNISLTAGYPVFDTNNRRVKLRHDLDATKANGFTLAEHKVDNTDSSPIQVLRGTHASIDKSSLYEVAYITIIRGDN